MKYRKTLNVLPPSANALWKWSKSIKMMVFPRAYAEFRRKVRESPNGQGVQAGPLRQTFWLAGRLTLRVKFCLPGKRRMDLDNRLKLIDCLEKNWFADDSQIKRIEADFCDCRKCAHQTVVEVEEIK